ncbi:uncharacterized protein LOC121522393 [Cheilinus undulatus]|uniref:uncharacterized protein LOC121522393 n=1 Tax=Cheilinus undulatus TaxID=241271 RepID=UPI001BD2DE37|nr:uncharacterized protein LOC121522393 [Cheilinus undulatus]
MEKDKLARIGNEDLRKAEEFVLLMRMHYTSTLAVSCENSPTCGQILPILQKLRKHYTVQADDSAFTRSTKENIWNDLSKCYQDADIQAFLEEATVLDPRFKSKVDIDEIWDRVRAAAVAANTPAAAAGKAFKFENDFDYPTIKQQKKTALEEFFEEEDSELLSVQQQPPVFIAQRVDQEVQLYRSLPLIPTKDSATLWWWMKRGHIANVVSFS